MSDKLMELAGKDRPILFSAPMVRALLDGRKTQTRRIAKITAIMGNRVPVYPPEELIELEAGEFRRGVMHYASTGALSGPYEIGFAVGDRLWVKETWSHSGDGVFEISQARLAGRGGIIYRADADSLFPHAKYWPSIFMPREFSRLTLLVDDVRIERLQDISEEDAVAEGIEDVTAEVAPRDPALSFWRRYRDGGWNSYVDTPIGSYASLWTEIHGPGSWEANPWVVAITFRVVRQNIDSLRALASKGGAE